MFMKVIQLTTLLSLWITGASASKNDDDEVDYIGFHTVTPMPYACSDMTAVTFDTDFDDNEGPRIYLSGGCIKDQECPSTTGCYCPEITNKCTYFTPETEKWHTDCTPSLVNRYRHMAAGVGNYMFIAGGRDVYDVIIKTIERYDVLNDTWVQEAVWESATSDGIAFSVSDMLYIVGGYNQDYSESVSTMIGYNITSKKFDYTLPSMKYGRGDINSVSRYGTDFYVVGGWAVPDFCNASKVVEYYSSVNNSWYEAPSLLYGRGDLAVGMMENNIFAVAGETKTADCSLSVPVSTVERLAAGNSGWNDEEAIPSDLFRFVGAEYNSTHHNNLRTTALYLFGGQTTYDEEKKTYSIVDSTIKYYPTSLGKKRKAKISKGGIAGIVIAGIVVLCLIICAIGAFLEYRRRGYHKLKEEEEDDDDDARMKGAANAEMIELGNSNGYVKNHDHDDGDKDNDDHQVSSPDDRDHTRLHGVHSSSSSRDDDQVVEIIL